MKKELLRKTVMAIVALFAFAVSASAEDAKLLSFGFFQANNPGLSKDYVATIPAVTAGKTTYDIEVALPTGTNLSALVAQFTVNEGNTVSIDGEAQTSGVSQYDFTDPVDYTVSNSTKTSNLRYTITIVEEQAEAKAWTELAVLDPAAVTGDETVTGVYAGTVLKINPKDNLPYVAFGVRGPDEKLSVAKFDGSAWSKIGAASFTNIVNGSHYAFDFSLDGTPYVAYGDQEATNKGSMSVMKFNGSAWSLVGDAGFANTQATYVGIAAVTNGIIAAQQNNSKSGDFARRAVVTSYWNGSTWASESPFASTYARQFTISNGKEAYILAVNASKPQDYSIIKTNGVEKSTIIENCLPEGATSGMNSAEISLALAPDGTLYLLAPDDAAGAAKMRLSVVKNGALQTVGGDVIPVTEGAYDRHSIVKAAIAPDGTPFVAYNDNSDDNNIYYISLNNETKQWTKPVLVASGAGTSPDVNIAFTATNTGYLTYSDKNNKIHLFMLEGEAPTPAPTKMWDFTKTSKADFNALSGNENWTYTESSKRFQYNVEVAKDTYVDLGEIGFAGGAGIEVGRAGGKMDAGKTIRVDVDNRIQLNASNGVFKVKNLKANDVVVITYASANNTEERTFTVTNADVATITAGAEAASTKLTIAADGDLVLQQTKAINIFTIAVYGSGNSEEAKPAIAFEAPAVERTITIGLNAAGKVTVDWGNGNKEEKEAAAAYDGWDNALDFTGTPAGTVKVYGEGISYFQAFTKYAANATTITDGITSIDLSGVAATLTELDVHQNNLKSIDLSKLTALTSLNAGVNDFTTIDLSANTELTKIDLSNGKNNGVLTALDLSKNTKLTTIIASGNQLTTLDLTNNTLAKTITILNNQLTSVTFGENTATKHTINLGGNKLTSVDISKFADASGTYLRVRDNDLTEVKLPAKVKQLWADGNNFTLAQLYALKDQTSTLTYAGNQAAGTDAQAPLAITADGDKVDLSAQAKLGETATVFTWKDAEGTALVEGTDYSVADGVFTFLKDLTGIYCEMTNAELSDFTAEKPYKTTAVDVTAAEVIDPSLIEIAQSQGKELDDFTRTELVEGSNYNTYTCTEGIQVAFKMFDIDVKGCDYVVVKFAEPVAAGWELAFWGHNDQSTVSVPAGATEFKYVFADDSKCAIANDILPQLTMLHLWTGTTPLVAKVKGIYKHLNTTGISNAKSTPSQNGAIFDLQGRRVINPTKGMYIVDGKKVMMK